MLKSIYLTAASSIYADVQGFNQLSDQGSHIRGGSPCPGMIEYD